MGPLRSSALRSAGARSASAASSACHLGVVGRRRRVQDHADRDRHRRLQGGEQGGELRVGLVVAEDVVAAGRDDLQAEAVGAQAQALVAVLAEQQRLAVGDVELGVGLVGLGGDVGEHVVVVDDAVLQDLDERGALVLRARV